MVMMMTHPVHIVRESGQQTRGEQLDLVLIPDSGCGIDAGANKIDSESVPGKQGLVSLEPKRQLDEPIYYLAPNNHEVRRGSFDKQRGNGHGHAA